MYRYHCLNNIATVGTDRLGKEFEPADDLADADATLVRSASLHDVQLPDRLLAIARAGAGVNNIPLDRCAERGVVVFNTPGANANAVKELVVTGMLLSARDVTGGINWVSSNREDPEISTRAEAAKKQFGGTELAGKSLGVIGLGAIGTMVANVGRSLGMHVYGYDPFLTVDYAWGLDRHVRLVRDLADVWENCDYITIHVPAADETRGMIGAEQIAAMREGVTFLNYARDALVDEVAMAEALVSGHVRHYVTDFANTTTTRMAGAIVTPHLGASTTEAEDNCAVMAADELRDYLLNGNIRNSVNYPDVDLGPLREGCRVAILHRNAPGVVGEVTSTLTSSGVSIANMSARRRGDFGYCLVEIDDTLPEDTLGTIRSIKSVFRTRLICSDDGMDRRVG